jgi:hypothetical protein
MDLDGNSNLLEHMSKNLKVRIQGKICFNFKAREKALSTEFEQATIQGIADVTRAEYIL